VQACLLFALSSGAALPCLALIAEICPRLKRTVRADVSVAL